MAVSYAFKTCRICGEVGHDGRRHIRAGDQRPIQSGKRRAHVENEHEMLRHLAGELGVRARDVRFHLPIARRETDAVERPKTRADCMAMARPCPFATCEFHLATEINEATGHLTVRFPDLEIHEMPETCALDVADKGGITLEEVGAILGLTRERIRQNEERGLLAIKRQTGYGLGLPPARDHDPMSAAG